MYPPSSPRHIEPRRTCWNRTSSWSGCWIVLLLCLTATCGLAQRESGGSDAVASETSSDRGAQVLTAGFVVLDGVYNSELMAPYDVLHHTIFRDSSDYIEPFVVSPDGQPVTTFEGITVTPHYAFDDAPPIDILVIPSTEGSMRRDLENYRFMTWLEEAADRAQYVLTVCDGAFPLAAIGALDGRVATTFPADRDRLAEMFPAVDVRRDVRLVVDGKFITSVGGGLSYEPAFYLVETLYSREHAEHTAQGLVWDWNLSQVPHFIVEE